MGIGKDYLSHPSTFNYMKSQSQATLIERRMREDWKATGSKDMYQRANEKVIDILETHEPSPLSEVVRGNIKAIVIEAEKALGIDDKS